MNSKKLLNKEQYKDFPYNYRLIEIIEINEKEQSSNEKKTIEIPKIQSSDYAKFFYKPISRIQ